MKKKGLMTAGILIICISMLGGCGENSVNEKNASAESVQTEEQGYDEDENVLEGDALFEDLDLSKLEDIKTAADRILEIENLRAGEPITKKAVPEGFRGQINVNQNEAQAAVSRCAYEYYKSIGNPEDNTVEEKLKEIEHRVRPYRFWMKYEKAVETGSDSVVMEMVMSGGGMSKVGPTLICISRNQGSSWDYRVVYYGCTDICYNGEDFAFVSSHLGDTASIQPSVLVVFENLGETVWRKDIGIVSNALNYYIDMDVLSVEKENGLTYVQVGYKGGRTSKDDNPYFLIMRFCSTFGDQGEIIYRNDSLFRMIHIWGQGGSNLKSREIVNVYSTVDFVFPDSSDRYLTREEILDWEQLSEQFVADAYPTILRRAINEIYARMGYDFSETDYSLFNYTDWYQAIPKREIVEEDLNPYEKYNIDLLVEMEKEAKEKWQ